MYEFILIMLFVISIVGSMFLLCFPVYILIKEERYYQKRKHEYYDEMIKTFKDTIKLYDSMIEQEKRCGMNDQINNKTEQNRPKSTFSMRSGDNAPDPHKLMDRMLELSGHNAQDKETVSKLPGGEEWR